jgi:ABC-2 type transport system ATP-binding protein
MTGTAQPAVEVADLVKRYPKQDGNAVDGLSFTVRYGEIFGLLGPNGAGKSTTIGVLTTRIRATSGRVEVGGVDVVRDPVAARARLAVVPQHNNLDRSLTPRQNLTYHAAYHGVGRAERDARAGRLLQRFGLEQQADAKIDGYSGGMAQRLMIARSLIHEPAVLFLDEPTNGLDPQTRLLVRGQIRDLRERGVTIVLTTHQLNEATELVDRVGIVDHGKLIALDEPADLIRGLGGRSVLDLTVTPGRDDDAGLLLAALHGVAGVRKGERLGPARARLEGALAGGRPGLRAAMLAAGGAGRAALRERAMAALTADNGPGVRLRLYLSTEPAAVLGPVLTVLYGRSATLNDVHIAQPSLEDVFIGLTGREPR